MSTQNVCVENSGDFFINLNNSENQQSLTKHVINPKKKKTDYSASSS